VRARPSRRADDGSHRLHARDARVACHRAGRRPISHGTTVVPAALRAPRSFRAVASRSRGATRGPTFDRPRPSSGRRSGFRPGFESRAQAEARSPARSPAEPTASAGNRDAHPRQRHVRGPRPGARCRREPAIQSRRQRQGQGEREREGKTNGQAHRPRTAGCARCDDYAAAVAPGRVPTARGREGSRQRQGEGPR
jgi:hypothetical protein